MGGGGHVFFANYTLILSYIFIKTNPIFLYNFCQKWLDTLFTGPNKVFLVLGQCSSRGLDVELKFGYDSIARAQTLVSS